MTTMSMMRIPSWLIVIVAVVLAAFGGRAISAQDKYTVQESWPRKFGRSGRWSFCLMTGTLCPSNQERS